MAAPDAHGAGRDARVSVGCNLPAEPAVYRVFGDQGAVHTDYFEGRHQISGRKAYDFLAARLGVE